VLIGIYKLVDLKNVQVFVLLISSSIIRILSATYSLG